MTTKRLNQNIPVWSHEADEILKKGTFLGEFGINNWMLSKQAMIQALHELQGRGIGIGGGDVFSLKGDAFKPTYDNWSVTPGYGETSAAFVTRSIDESIRYVREYRNRQYTNIGFVIVPVNYEESIVFPETEIPKRKWNLGIFRSPFKRTEN